VIAFSTPAFIEESVTPLPWMETLTGIMYLDYRTKEKILQGE
jgi:hypothetical protein